MFTASQSTIIRRDSKVNFFANVNGTFDGSALTKFITGLKSKGLSLPSGWVGAIPRPTQRTGPVEHKALKLYEHTIPALSWDNTIDIDLNMYADAKDEAKIESIVGIAGNIGKVNADHMLYRATQVLASGAGTTIAVNGFDGGAFFSTTHNESGSNQVNTTTVSGVTTAADPTTANVESGLKTAIQTMLAHTDDQGKPVSFDPTTLVVMYPAGMSDVMSRVLNANGTLGGGQVSTVGVATDSARSSAVYRTLSRQHFCNPMLPDTDRFYILREGGNGNAGPLILNERSAWDLIYNDRNTGSDHAILNDVAWWTSKGRLEVGFGDWRCAYRVLFTT